MEEWLLTRGLSPEKLALEPLTQAYDNLIQSFVNIGYTLGSTLFAALWDWRVPVGVDVSAYEGDTPAEARDGALTS